MIRRAPLFTKEMRQAVRDGGKVETRRPVDISKLFSGHETSDSIGAIYEHPPASGTWRARGGDWNVWSTPIKPPFGVPGDTWYLCEPLKHNSETGWAYYADDGFTTWDNDKYPPLRWRWKRDTLSSMHMPREAARTFMRVTELRVERVQDITEEDAVAEGMEPRPEGGCIPMGVEAQADGLKVRPEAKGFMCVNAYERAMYVDGPIKQFQGVWESLYPGSWDRNDWNFVYTWELKEGE